ncbi:DUF881 domain-containing protein [Nocardioides sp. KR10-350]|uniref:DUF881 domain-containing protein n=1 Tax=Nocardioides cheoyonin TaxID=3156615 RepID=UPI0032B3981E
MPARVPEAVTMPLLARITQQSLDEDYHHVADRRRTTGEASASAGGRRLTVIAVVAFGLLVAIAGVQTSRNAPIQQESREVLISRIDARQKTVASMHRSIAELTDENTNSESRYATLGDQLKQATARVRALGQRTGFGPVSGAGVRITVDDNPDGDEDGMVRDSDLASLVNGLWEAGATAVSVDGQRVTAKSGLRNSGSVIRMNNVSLSPPYVVLALGDNRTLLAKLAETTSGSSFTTITSQLGMPVKPENVDSLQLPSAPASMLHLQYAHSNTGKTPQEDN